MRGVADSDDRAVARRAISAVRCCYLPGQDEGVGPADLAILCPHHCSMSFELLEQTGVPARRVAWFAWPASCARRPRLLACRLDRRPFAHLQLKQEVAHGGGKFAW
jgi:hypothetical protein